jgi:hypothetical protein
LLHPLQAKPACTVELGREAHPVISQDEPGFSDLSKPRQEHQSFNAELEHFQFTQPVELFLSLGDSVHATRT